MIWVRPLLLPLALVLFYFMCSTYTYISSLGIAGLEHQKRQLWTNYLLGSGASIEGVPFVLYREVDRLYRLVLLTQNPHGLETRPQGCLATRKGISTSKLVWVTSITLWREAISTRAEMPLWGGIMSTRDAMPLQRQIMPKRTLRPYTENPPVLPYWNGFQDLSPSSIRHPVLVPRPIYFLVSVNRSGTKLLRFLQR